MPIINPVHSYSLSLVTQGDTGAASRVRVTALDFVGNKVKSPFQVRVKVANDGDYDGESTNATIAAVASSSSEIQDNGTTGDKDLTFLALTSNGYLDIDLTDASAETVTVYVGTPDFGGSGGKTQGIELDVTHASA